jgi:hypothetical protein
MIDAELQTVLPTLTKHDFQDAFEDGRSARNGAYVQTMVMVASRAIVSF